MTATEKKRKTGTIEILCTVPAPTIKQMRAWFVREGWERGGIWKRSEDWWLTSHDQRFGAHLTRGGIATTIARIAGVLTHVRGTTCTPETVYREIMGPVNDH